MIVKSCLIHHPNTSVSLAKQMHIGVKALFQNGLLRLHYDLLGPIDKLLIPEPSESKVTDGLWQHTCFEAFVAVVEEAPYREFNFSPSSQWAAYGFKDYRQREDWQITTPPAFICVRTPDRLSIEAVIAEVDLPRNPRHQAFRLGLTAVLETTAGELSYWALCHPAGVPDFHHRTGFTLSF